MSTTLQSLWRGSTNYGLHETTAMVSAINRTFTVCLPDVDRTIGRLQELHLSIQENSRNQFNVLSCEGMTFSFIHRSDLGDYVLLKQRFLAELLGHTSRKVLIMIRDPLDWMVSAHAQHVREGGCVALRDYAQLYRSVMLNNLNLQATADFWKAAGCEIVILPIELYRQNRTAFWSAYETRLGVDAPDSREVDLGPIGANTTNYDTLDLHQTLNAALTAMQEIVANNAVPRQADCLQAIKFVRQWGTRRALTFSDSDQNRRLRQILNQPEQADPAPLTFDRAFVDYLQTYFLAVIDESESMFPQSIRQQYEQTLRAMVLQPGVDGSNASLLQAND
ncbi:MAG: hypothetical protein HKN42_03900 [Granulosicoccus sp.]|nr:hypothetical protein [Granulosicoccus sp.]